MTKLTEGMVIGRTRAADLASVRRLNCWGSELMDVSLVRSMKFVEVLSLSVNKITTLADFAHCPNLQELFVRKNQISDLSEILYLKDLPKLHSFWLEDNPCAVGDRYRLTVLKYLPQLKKLDNIAVQPEELRDAVKYGIVLEFPGDKDSTCAVQTPTSDSTSSPPSAQNSTPSPSHSGGHHIPQPPERDNDFDAEGNVFPTYAVGSPDSQQAEKIPYVTSTYVNSGDKAPAPREVSHSSDHLTPDDSSLAKINRRSRQDTFVHGNSFEKEIMSPPTDQQSPIMTHDHRTHQQPLPPISNMVPPPPLSRDQREFHELHHSHSIPTHSHSNVHMVHSDVYAELAPEDHEPRFREEVYRYSAPPQPPPLVMQHPAHQSLLKHHPHGQLYEKIMDSPNKPYPTRPKNRNSNILSAVLCLIKELDCASLEVVEMAARCRMDELDD